MGLDDVLEFTIYKDDQRVGILKMRREYVERLAFENGLDSFLEEALCLYACVESPVLVIWGAKGGKTKIVGLTVNPETLRAESALRQAWEQNRSASLTVRDVHAAIATVAGQVLN